MCSIHPPITKRVWKDVRTTNTDTSWVDEIAEWCSSFVIVPKSSGRVQLCLDPARLSQALTRLIHTGPTQNNVLLKLTYAHCMTIIDVSPGYNNLKLNKKASYLATFSCQFCRYWFTREVRYYADSCDHNRTPRHVIQICHQGNSKLNKN